MEHLKDSGHKTKAGQKILVMQVSSDGAKEAMKKYYTATDKGLVEYNKVADNYESLCDVTYEADGYKIAETARILERTGNKAVLGVHINTHTSKTGKKEASERITIANWKVGKNWFAKNRVHINKSEVPALIEMLTEIVKPEQATEVPAK